jgi:tryptophan synthase beta chain
MQSADGQTCDVHSISAGLDYPGVGPEHSFWKSSGRVDYTQCLDSDVLKAFSALAHTEGILAALETSHAIWIAMQLARQRPADETVVVCLSGRGDKDASEIARLQDSVSSDNR